MANRHNQRSRSFAMILYEEDESHMQVLDKIVNDGYFYAFIRHDCDVYDTDIFENNLVIHHIGDIKKPHYHVLLDFPNPRSVSKLKDLFGLSHIETCNFYFYTRYLIHLDDKNKYQYSKDLIETNILTRINNALTREFNQDEQDSRLLYNFIKEKNFCSLVQLTDFALEHDCFSELKRNIYFYKSFCSY